MRTGREWLYLNFVAENERTNIRRRQAEGIMAAKMRGVRFGRPSIPLPDNFDEIRKNWREGKIQIKEAAEACNMKAKTFYSKAVKYEKEKSLKN